MNYALRFNLVSVNKYKFQVACLILKQTFILFFDNGLHDSLDHSSWQKLSPNLILSSDVFEQIKQESKEIYNAPDRESLDFDLFWKTIFPNLSAISTNTEIAVLRQRLQNFLLVKKASKNNLGREHLNVLNLSQEELDLELKWIDETVNSQRTDRLLHLRQKLQFCEDKRLKSALNLAICKLNDIAVNNNKKSATLVNRSYEGIALEGLNNSSVKDQLTVIANLLDKGDQASLALVGLFVLHEDQAVRDIILDGLTMFDDQDLIDLLELMRSNQDLTYRKAALKIQQEIVVKGIL